jgi:hypothetical protein
MSFDLTSILSGFGVQQPGAVGTIGSGAASGAASGAMAGGGNPYAAVIGALIGAGTSYLDYRTMQEQAKAALELGELQLAMVQAAQQGAPVGGVTQAPAYTAAPVAAPQQMMAPAPAIGREFYTPGDTGMGILDPYLQQIGLGPATQPGGVVTGAGGLPLPGQAPMALAPGGLFGAPSAVAARAIPQIEAVNPVTGKTHVWKHMGRPVLYTGDLAACRRVNRVAKRVAKAMPKRRLPKPSGAPSSRRRSCKKKNSSKRRRDKRGRFI